VKSGECYLIRNITVYIRMQTRIDTKRRSSACWSVAATIRARKEYVNDFIAYYSSLGAQEIFIFFDDPTVCEFDNAHKGTKVLTFICDDRYWSASVGSRPKDMNRRQDANFRYAFGSTKSEWLLNVDLDERIYVSKSITTILNNQEDKVFSISIPSVEAVYEEAPSTNTAFRTPWFKRQLRDIDGDSIVVELYKDLSPMTTRGVFGHSRKYFVRTMHAAKDLRIHFATPENSTLTTITIPGVELLHFDSLTFYDWKEKWALRLIFYSTNI
jgi:hypothetical protein